MNPWTIVSWIGAICVAVLIIACTIRAVVNLIHPSKTGAKPILGSRRER